MTDWSAGSTARERATQGFVIPEAAELWNAQRNLVEESGDNNNCNDRRTVLRATVIPVYKKAVAGCNARARSPNNTCNDQQLFAAPCIQRVETATLKAVTIISCGTILSEQRPASSSNTSSPSRI